MGRAQEQWTTQLEERDKRFHEAWAQSRRESMGIIHDNTEALTALTTLIDEHIPKTAYPPIRATPTGK